MVLRSLYNGVSMLTGTAAYSVLAAAVLPFDGGRHTTKVARAWGRHMNWLCGVDVQVDGLDQPLDATAYLVMANHSSHFDLPGIFSRLPIDMRPVAKRELGKIPIFGWVLKAGAAIMIDRGDREQAKESIERAGQTIRAGRSVLMFPEGTRTATPEVAELKKGPFYLAVEARVPVLPVGIIGTAQVLRPHDWQIRPGKVSVRVGKPIETTAFAQDEAGRDALRQQVADALEALVEQGHIPA